MADQLERDTLPVTGEESESEKLLREWALWWLNTDNAPAKMPNALHVRTSMYFVRKKLENKEVEL